MSMASHQIQTPLTAIRGYVSLILEDPEKSLKSSYEEMLKKVMVSAERVIQLVSDFLIWHGSSQAKWSSSLKMQHGVNLPGSYRCFSTPR